MKNNWQEPGPPSARARAAPRHRSKLRPNVRTRGPP
jgi:hypothetical protein